MARRRALLISYHFPPSPVAGAQRWDVFTRTAVQKGWEFDVVTQAEPLESDSLSVLVHHVPASRHWLNRLSDILLSFKSQLDQRVRARNPSASSLVPPLTVQEQVIPREEIRFPRGMDDYRRNLRALLVHTHVLPWMNAAAVAAKRLIATRSYDVIIASGPPHVAAEAARIAGSGTGVPIVLDFRDPWSLIDVVAEGWASWSYLRLASRLERRAVKASTLVVMNTPAATRAMCAHYPSADVITVPNGFNGMRREGKHPPDRFIAMFTGNIYLDRDPRPLLAAVARLAPELQLSPANFCLRFYGAELNYAGHSLNQLASSAGVPSNLVEACPPLARAGLFEEMQTAALLVNLPQGARLCVPSKVYEYLHFPAWVLGLETAGSATHEVLTSVGADIAEPGDVDAITAILRRRLLDFRAGERPAPLAAPDQYFSPREAERFFAAVEERLRAGAMLEGAAGGNENLNRQIA